MPESYNGVECCTILYQGLSTLPKHYGLCTAGTKSILFPSPFWFDEFFWLSFLPKKTIGFDLSAFHDFGFSILKRSLYTVFQTLWKIPMYTIRKCHLTRPTWPSCMVFNLKMESVSKNTIFGLKMMVKSGLEKVILKSLHAYFYYWIFDFGPFFEVCIGKIVSRMEEFQKDFFRDHFSLSFLGQKL